ncbi:MAG: T9SS type A sorting domain-containing protein [Flavobacteriaceae bacterium]|nr:T9SS type A sorting domain-containing protein [Flavobacteriaceae bacterium]
MKTKLLTLFFLTIGYLSFTQTNFAEIQNIGTANKAWRIASGDLDGDNIIDLAIAGFDTGAVDYIRWYKNDGNGNFTETSTSLVSSTIDDVDGLTIADIDGQHGNDIIATSQAQDKLIYFLSDGAGGFNPEVQVGGAIDYAGQVVAGDINKDGNIDIALVSWGVVVGDEKVSWFSGDGLGGFTAETDIASGGTDGSGPWTIDIGDFDGDTDLDILVGYYSSGIEIYYNQYIETGSATFIKDTVTVDSGFSYLIQTIFGDVNNDGIMDVVKVDNSSGDVEWYSKIKNGASTAYMISDETIIDRPGAVAIADVDNDTYNDVILTDGGSVDTALIWFKGASNTSPSTTPVFEDDSNHQLFSLSIDDFDYDGYLDIAYTGYFSSSGVNWYENETDILSLNENEIELITVYPNPAKNEIIFKGLQVNNKNLIIFDILGKEVIKTSVSNNNNIDISILQSGLYFVKIEGINKTMKFLKE